MDTYKHIQQLNSLVVTIDDLLADSIVAQWHSTLLCEAKKSFNQIQQKAVLATQKNLIEQMIQQLADVEQEIQISLETPLESLCNLVNENHIPQNKKIQLLIQVGKTYDILGKWDKALDVFHQAADYCKDNSEPKAEIFKYLGHLKSKKQDYSSANKFYLDSLAIYTLMDNKSEISNIYLCQGYNYFEQGNYEQAEAYCLSALKLADEQEDNRVIADCNNSMGIMATVKGTFDDAITSYQKSIQAYESLDDIPGLAMTYHNMAMLQVDINNWKDAGESYRHALEYAQQAGNLELMGVIHLNRAELAIKLYDYTMAKACCDHALGVFGRLGNKAGIAETYKFLGRISRQQEEWDDASHFLEKGIQLNASAQDNLFIGEARYEYGLMYLGKGDKDNAKKQFTKALKIFDKLGASMDLQKVKDELEKLKGGKEDKEPKIKRLRRIKRKR